MSLRGWSWDAAIGPAGLGDRPLLEALEAAIPDEAVEATIEATGTRERRRRLLPTHLVVTLVVAMGLWASESMRHVLAEVVAGWREGSENEQAGWHLPSTAAIVQARQRAGARLLRELFGAVAGPIATAQTPGAFLGGLRLMAIDGTTLDVADTPENDRAFGRPTTGRGVGAFLQIRVLALIETAATYHESREIETAPDEVNIRQWAHPRPLRSKHPRELVQQVYGFLLGHLAIRTVMYQDAERAGEAEAVRIDPVAHGVLRRAIPRAQRTPQPTRRQAQDERLPAKAPTAHGLRPDPATPRRDGCPCPLALSLSVLALARVSS